MSSSLENWLETFRARLEEANFSASEKESLTELFHTLLESVETLQPGTVADSAEILSARLFSHRNLIALIRQQSAELDAFKRIAYNLTSNLELQAVLDTVVSEATRLIKGAHNAHIYLYQDGQLTFGASLSMDGVKNQEYNVPRQNGLTYQVARLGQMVIIEDMRRHPLYRNFSTNAHMAGSILGLPLKSGETVIGVMNLSREQQGAFKPAELRLLQMLADQATLAILNARMHEALAMQALSDTLTGLPNRRALDRRLEGEVSRATRYGRTFAVLMMDLDGFKAINDTWGHAVGDQVLHDVARFLAASARASDFLARYGGDELTMILPEASRNGAVEIATNIQTRFANFGFTLPDGSNTRLGISGGIAVYPTHAHTASDLLRAADEALYSAKRHARGTFVVAKGFTGELQMPGLKNPA
ncbi:MAG: hypothetical protein CO094_12825 [Anaerolineae bacterium CG_4_9_14_3_um_filter_57_17]|nr:sensor domain-containing diguanylate cyclase [bacterium]NCT21121.1 sensor domain-containing diguanylate cyclase [bacterium]OIO83357.1 MAG: hypothetical protein AUK01_13045 [Anaerolineae bacterium CG2_30_57_67]PJB64542.1 MAG: hypothetical protein CO094_12825 [Anaerolineae bacterium CG_4_9_14_3_um_filter_57_17]